MHEFEMGLKPEIVDLKAIFSVRDPTNQVNNCQWIQG
jgi:hypothetical protein